MTSSCRYAFIVSRFPKLTETFILQELRGLEARRLDFELFALIHESAEQLQPDAADLDARAHYVSWHSLEAAAAQWHWLRTSPRRWARSWWRAFQASRRSREALLRFPVTTLIAGVMARRMQGLGIDRVHAHWATYPTLAALVIKDLAGIPYSFTGHAQDVFVERGGLQVKVAEADAVLTCTDHGRGVIAARCGQAAAAKVHLVHHGVTLDRFAIEPLRPAPGGDRPARILCVAALETYKGHRYLLEAVRVLVDRGVDVELVLIGDGYLRDELEAQGRELGIRVDVQGRRPSEHVRAELRDCDLFVAPSIELDNGFMDGIPNVLVEALAVGRPVVASSLAGIRELIIDGETGVLVEPADPVSIADAVARLLDDPELAARVVAGGRAKVEAEHDAATNLDEVDRILRDLC